MPDRLLLIPQNGDQQPPRPRAGEDQLLGDSKVGIRLLGRLDAGRGRVGGGLDGDERVAVPEGFGLGPERAVEVVVVPLGGVGAAEMFAC